MELTEQAIMNAFGVGTEAGTGGNGQEIAEPAPQEQESGQAQQGGNEPEPAAPVDNSEGQSNQQGGETEPPAQQAEPSGESEQKPTQEKPPQTPEENRQFAAARRKAEQDAAIEQARQAAREEARRAADEEMKQFFASAGLRNPYSKTPITNMEEYRQYQEQHRTEQLRKAMAEGKLTPEQLDEAIIQNPAIRQILDERAKQAQAAPAEGQEAQQPQEQPAPQVPATPTQDGQMRARIDAEVAEIGRFDPAIKETADLLKQPWSKEFYRYVQEGYSFLGAYHKAVSVQQTQQAAAAAKQQAINNVASKQHLKSGAPQGGGMEAVPAGDMRYFRAFMPDASEADIQRYYNQYRKQTK